MVLSLDPGVQASPFGIAVAATTETPSFSSDRVPRSLAHQDIAVQIAEPEPETLEDFQLKKQFSAGVGKRLSGRPPVVSANSSRTSPLSQNGLEVLSGLTSSQSPLQAPADSDMSHSHHRRHRLSEKLISQVAEWIEHERTKKSNRKSTRLHHGRRKSKSPPKGEAVGVSDSMSAESSEHAGVRPRSYSIDSHSSEVSLDRLQRIIDDGLSALGLHSVPHYGSRVNGRRSQRKRSANLLRAASSDTEYYDGDVLVPKCDAWLDNSKTMSYSGGGAADDVVSGSSGKEDKERKAWLTFKTDIIRITHTLRIKGWRRVPLDGGDSIEVERLSGALTNAVYVVSPPADIARTPEPGKKTPAKLLLRIYGAQVENIIDRHNELSVLRRLARKKIGPRLLGQFENGRFEEFFNATALTPQSLREPYTSKKIAKRMRELHDGIELLEDEKDGGPGVFKNWDHWLPNVERISTLLDQKVLSSDGEPIRGPTDAWRGRGLVLGVEWPKFKATVEKYRHWLDAHYGGPRQLREQLVFAHNDTQYGNILRVRPDDQMSPLLQPQNEHKQLIVIDFEYAGPNVRGYEFANHFTEWTYNYHDAQEPHVCSALVYPKPEDQRRFIKAYVQHRPEFPHAGSTPNLKPLDTPSEAAGDSGFLLPTPASTSSITDFMLDARAPSGGWREDEKRREEQVERQVDELMEETRLWRIANSAFWIAWGIMQAKVPDLEDDAPNGEPATVEATQTDAPASSEEDAGGSEFDYLAYAQERALLFWGDCVQMGLVKLEQLPEELRAKIKLIEY